MLLHNSCSRKVAAATVAWQLQLQYQQQKGYWCCNPIAPRLVTWRVSYSALQPTCCSIKTAIVAAAWQHWLKCCCTTAARGGPLQRATPQSP